MNRRITLTALLLLLCLCIGAFGVSAESIPRLGGNSFLSDDVTLFLNSSETFSPAQSITVGRYLFTPATSGSFIFRGFPTAAAGYEPVTARLTTQSGLEITRANASGGFRLPATLTQGETYVLEITARGGFTPLRIEVMQDVYGRSYDQPTQLSGKTVHYSRAIVKARETHWYAFTAAYDGWYVIRSETDALSPDLNGLLVDESGFIIAENDDILFPADGNFRICARLTKGRTYAVRVSAASNQMGSYRLVIAAPEEGTLLPNRAVMSTAKLQLKTGESAALSLTIQPENAQNDVAWLSEDRAIAAVDGTGLVTAVSPGRTIVHAYTGRLELVCEVIVPTVPLTSLTLTESELTLSAGETCTLTPAYAPENATLSGLVWTSGDEAIATVQDGAITALTEGEAVISVRDEATGKEAGLTLTVLPAKPVYRALVLGEMNYETGRTRTGGENTAQGVADMLLKQSIDGSGYAVTVRIDTTREELLEAIDTAFAGARETDVSLFYINCHGDYDDEAWIELHDGTRITAVQLEQLLRGIPGRVVVILDCCRSGGFLGNAAQFTDGVAAAFAKSPLTTGKYVVLTSASASEDSYRRSFAAGTDEGSMATIMSRALCEGAGWDLISDRICTLKADVDKDKRITVQEIFLYTGRRVLFYLDGTGVTQTVSLWPEGDQTVLFGRE